MKIRFLTVFLVLATAGNASIIVSSTPGLTTIEAGATTITFDAPIPGAASPFTYTSPSGIAATYTWSGISPFVTGSVSGQYAAPPSDSTTYLAAGAGAGRPGTVNIAFSQAINYFGFYTGSPDSYNSIDFFGPNESFSGSDLGLMLNFPANGDQAFGKFLNFNSTIGITQIQFTSTFAAFETDNHAFGNAVPEPTTYALIGAGLAALGVLRSRRRRPGSR